MFLALAKVSGPVSTWVRSNFGSLQLESSRHNDIYQRLHGYPKDFLLFFHSLALCSQDSPFPLLLLFSFYFWFLGCELTTFFWGFGNRLLSVLKLGWVRTGCFCQVFLHPFWGGEWGVWRVELIGSAVKKTCWLFLMCLPWAGPSLFFNSNVKQ